MCVLNTCAPGDCVRFELLYSCWGPRLVSHERRGTQRSSLFIFLTVRLLTKWEGCNNGGFINPTKTSPSLQYLIYPHKTWSRKNTIQCVLRGCLCFCPCEGQEGLENEGKPQEVRTFCWWSHKWSCIVTYICRLELDVAPLYKKILIIHLLNTHTFSLC